MNERTHDPETPGEPPALDEPTQASASQNSEQEPVLTRPLSHKRRWPWITGIILGIVAVAAAAWLWFGHSSEEQAKAKGRGDATARTMPVVATPARKGNIDVYITAL